MQLKANTQKIIPDKLCLEMILQLPDGTIIPGKKEIAGSKVQFQWKQRIDEKNSVLLIRATALRFNVRYAAIQHRTDWNTDLMLINSNRRHFIDGTAYDEFSVKPSREKAAVKAPFYRSVILVEINHIKYIHMGAVCYRLHASVEELIEFIKIIARNLIYVKYIRSNIDRFLISLPRKIYHYILAATTGRARYRTSLVREQECQRKSIGPKVCLFASYAVGGEIKANVRFYLQSLCRAGFDIIFITTSPRIPNEDMRFLRKYCCRVVLRTNVGYDFGSWALGWNLFRTKITNAKELLIANDSVYGPLFDLGEVLCSMRRRDADACGCTDSHENRYHLQSYFILLNERVLRSGVLDEFFSNYLPIENKMLLVQRYEIGLSIALQRHGFRLGALCEYSMLSHNIIWKDNDHPYAGRVTIPVNPTHYYWDILVNKYKCPFIKKELLLKNPAQIVTAGIDFRKYITVRSNYDFSMVQSEFRCN